MNKKEFLFYVTYFNMKGRPVLQTNFTYKCRFDSKGNPNINDVASHIRGLRDSGGQGALYGLDDEGWNGYIHVADICGKSCLILPGKE